MMTADGSMPAHMTVEGLQQIQMQIPQDFTMPPPTTVPPHWALRNSVFQVGLDVSAPHATYSSRSPRTSPSPMIQTSPVIMNTTTNTSNPTNILPPQPQPNSSIPLLSLSLGRMGFWNTLPADILFQTSFPPPSSSPHLSNPSSPIHSRTASPTRIPTSSVQHRISRNQQPTPSEQQQQQRQHQPPQHMHPPQDHRDQRESQQQQAQQQQQPMKSVEEVS